MSRSLLLGHPRCDAEITVSTAPLIKRTTRAETVWCVEPRGHDAKADPTPHHGVATQLRRRPISVTWHVNRHGHAVLDSPDNLVEVP